VRDHDQRLAVVLDRLAEQRKDLAACPRVEVAGRLVREDDRRVGDQCPGDGDALLLTTGELGGPVLPPVGEADTAHQLVHPPLVRLLARDREREGDVFLRVQHRHEVEELEDEADVAAAQLGQLGVVQVGDVDAVDLDRETGLGPSLRLA
jgi:hypothetical protein